MKNKNGFTLIELLVSIAIISILTGVSIVGLNSIRNKAKDTKRIADVRQLQIALATYKSVNGKYPASGGWLAENYIVGLAPAFISKLPVDPNGSGGSYGYSYQDYNNGKFYCFTIWASVYNIDAQPLWKYYPGGVSEAYPGTWSLCDCATNSGTTCAPN